MPFAAGPVLAAGLAHHATVRTVASIALWVLWTAALVATLVPHPISLTVVRIFAPAAAGAVVAAVVEGHSTTAAALIGLAGATVVSVVAFLPEIAAACVNGPAYANERRYPLAVPGALLLGPLELAWAILVGLPTGALLLLAARQWIVGSILTLLSVGAVVGLGRALHGLARRWVVFVPAGIVLHDPMTLIDPVLFQRSVIEHLGPAPAGTDALDLTHGAPGLALELHLKEEVPVVRRTPPHRRGEAGASARLLFTATRPGAVLAEARRRRLPVALTLPPPRRGPP
jgi:hypothetical protein